MALGDNLTSADRMILNVVIVLGLSTVGFGLLYFLTGWDIAETAVHIVGPIAVIGVFVGLIRSWWPRD